MIYLIGSLRNPQIPTIANKLREGTKQDVFDDWYAAGPEADDYWRDYERGRGHSLPQALNGYAARNTFEFDRRNLTRADMAVLAMPAGKSAFLELGWCLGQGKKGYILLDADPDRYDVMFNFADGIFTNIEELIHVIKSSADQLDQVGHPLGWLCNHAISYNDGGRCALCERSSWGV